MVQKENNSSSKYMFVLVAIVAIVAIVALFKIANSGKSSGLTANAADFTGNAVAMHTEQTPLYTIINNASYPDGKCNNISSGVIDPTKKVSIPGTAPHGSSWGSAIFQSQCSNLDAAKKTLTTYSCNQDLSVQKISISCTYGCSNGVCLYQGQSAPTSKPKSATQLVCNDTDGGLNYLVKGSVSYNTGKFEEDYCTNTTTSTNNLSYGKYLVEKYCNNGVIDSVHKLCDGHCDNGKCDHIISCAMNGTATDYFLTTNFNNAYTNYAQFHWENGTYKCGSYYDSRNKKNVDVSYTVSGCKGDQPINKTTTCANGCDQSSGQCIVECSEYINQTSGETMIKGWVGYFYKAIKKGTSFCVGSSTYYDMGISQTYNSCDNGKLNNVSSFCANGCDYGTGKCNPQICKEFTGINGTKQINYSATPQLYGLYGKWQQSGVINNNKNYCSGNNQTILSCNPDNSLNAVTTYCPDGCDNFLNQGQCLTCGQQPITNITCSKSYGAFSSTRVINQIIVNETTNKCTQTVYNDWCGYNNSSSPTTCQNGIGCCKDEVQSVSCDGNNAINTTKNLCTGEVKVNKPTECKPDWLGNPTKCTEKTYQSDGKTYHVTCEAACTEGQIGLTSCRFDKYIQKWYYLQAVCGIDTYKGSSFWNTKYLTSCPTGTTCVVKSEDSYNKNGVCQ